MKKIEIIGKKNILGQVNFLAEVLIFVSFTTVCKGQKLFLQNMAFMGVERRRTLRRFQKYKLAPQKSYF
jgi:hypothetical protein